jgi:hypothetical protein
MDFEQDKKKGIWSEPKIFNLDFSKTKGGSDISVAEDFGGTISTLP